jgi:hypothetical protein
MDGQSTIEREQRRLNSGLAKVAVPFLADSFVVNQSLALRIKVSCENRHLRQAANLFHHGSWK